MNLVDGRSLKFISTKYGICLKSLQNMRRRFKKAGFTFNTETRRRSSVAKLTEEDISNLIEDAYHYQNTTATIKERLKLLKESNPSLNITESGLLKHFKKLGFSCKRTTFSIKKENTLLTLKKRKIAIVDLLEIISTQTTLICLDETGFNIHTQFGRGWSQKGTKAILKINSRFENISVIAAISYNSLLCYTLKRGAFISADICEFIRTIDKTIKEKNIPVRNQPVLLMDNSSLHKTAAVLELCEEIEYRVLFIAPYSPQLNAIEQLFCRWKHSIKSICVESREEMIDAICTAASAFSEEEIRTCFNRTLSVANKCFNMEEI